MESDGFTYLEIKEGLLLLSAGTCRDADIVIPSVFEEKPVVVIGPEAFEDCSWIRSVSVPEGVRVISPGAFKGCSGMERVDLPASIEQVGEGAFFGCTALREVRVPDLGAWCGVVFKSFSSNPLACADEFLVAGEKVTDLVIPAGTEKIRDFAFSGFRGLRSVTFPSGVTEIGAGAFMCCPYLASVTIGKDVGKIAGSAFEMCPRVVEIIDLTPDMKVSGTMELSALTVNVSGGEEGRGEFFVRDGFSFYRYEGETYLTGYAGTDARLKFPETEFDYKIADRAFTDLQGVTSVVFPACCKAVGKSSFEGCLRIITADTGPGMEHIDSDAFLDCVSLAKIVIGGKVKRIGENAFDGCSKLIEVENFSSLNLTPGSKDYGGVALCAKNVYTKEGGSLFETIDGFVFFKGTGGAELVYYDGDGDDVSLPELVDGYDIHEEAFFYCTAFRRVRVPGCVKKIGRGAFIDCDFLSSVTLEEGVEVLDDFAFSSNGVSYVIFPTSLKKIGQNSFSKSAHFKRVYYLGDKDAWEKINVDENNEDLFAAEKYWYSEKRPDEDGRFWHYSDGDIVVW